MSTVGFRVSEGGFRVSTRSFKWSTVGFRMSPGGFRVSKKSLKCLQDLNFDPNLKIV